MRKTAEEYRFDALVAEIQDDLQRKALKKQPNGCYRKCISVYADDYNRIYIGRVSVYGKTPMEIAEKLLKKEAQEKGKYFSAHKRLSADTHISFADFAEKWFLEEIQEKSISEKNKKNYRSVLDNHLLPYFRNTAMSDLTVDDFNQYLKQFVGKSQSHINYQVMTVSGILKKAYNRQISERLMCDALQIPKAADCKRDKAKLTMQELNLLLSVANAEKEKDDIAVLFVLMYCIGNRPQAVQEMRWEDVNLLENYIFLHEKKSKNGQRIVPLCNYATHLLKELQEKQQRENRYAKDGLIFRKKTFLQETSRNTRTAKIAAIDSKTLNRYWHAFFRKMDIKNGAVVKNNQIVESTMERTLTLYHMRYSFVQNVLSSHIDLIVAKTMFGHSIQSEMGVTAEYIGNHHESKEKILEKYKENESIARLGVQKIDEAIQTALEI